MMHIFTTPPKSGLTKGELMRRGLKSCTIPVCAQRPKTRERYSFVPAIAWPSSGVLASCSLGNAGHISGSAPQLIHFLIFQGWNSSGHILIDQSEVGKSMNNSSVLNLRGRPLIIWGAWCGFPRTIFFPACLQMSFFFNLHLALPDDQWSPP